MTRLCALAFFSVFLSLGATATRAADPVFRAGAAAVDVSPVKLPVIVNGGFLAARADKIRDPLFVRAIVLDDGTTRLAVAVIDNCMLPRELIDQAKERARQQTGIPVERMLISATHTHTAPSTMGSLGTPPDPDYVTLLPPKIAESIARAAANLAPAHIGWAVVDDFEHTHCRRWIRRPDRVIVDPFGLPTARANMHPGYQSPDVIGPAGPVDPGLSVLALRSANGKPLALLANYSMHYFGTEPVSADYFGRFVVEIGKRVGGAGSDPPFVAMMSQGTSGDQHWMNYAEPKSSITMDAYAAAVAERALSAFQKIEYRPWVRLAMAESRLTLRRRVPDETRLAWARQVAAAMKGRPPATLPEVYALEAIALHKEPERELKLQAIRIGDLGIAAIPNEVYALSGLKIKAQSPLTPTFTMELANGSEGYIPPPEQHALGGYTTWPARTAGLEVQAEPEIVEGVLTLLEQVAGSPRRVPREPDGAYSEAVLASAPLAYWRLGEMTGNKAADATGHRHSATITGRVALALDGPSARGFSRPSAINRAVHLAGGSFDCELPELGTTYSVEFWFWNGLPNDARGDTGTLFAREDIEGPSGDVLFVGGTAPPDAPIAIDVRGRLLFCGRDRDRSSFGLTEIPFRTWHHVVLVRKGADTTVYLDGMIEIQDRVRMPSAAPRLILGASRDLVNLEGKLDEVAVYDRALTAAEAAEHFRASGMP
jgi:hypothetical protein